jgi:hypothetical protein
MFEKLVTWSRVKSPWVLHLNSGSCNGCDIEILAALMPRFDAERFGVVLQGTDMKPEYAKYDAWITFADLPDNSDKSLNIFINPLQLAVP